MTVGYSHRVYIRSASGAYGCARCRTHLAALDQLESNAFQGQTGRAYLFRTVVNVKTGKAEDRAMTTGLHTVADISCRRCESHLGWTYILAYENSQKYKEGKFILEKAKIMVVDQGLAAHSASASALSSVLSSSEDEDFDAGDESE